MEKKTIGGRKVIFHNSLKEIIKKHPALFKYEPSLIIKAFKKTMWYFIENALEFDFKNFFKFTKVHRKAFNNYVRYRDEYQIIPEHDDILLKPYKSLKDFVNSRHKFKDTPHREKLIDEERKPNIF